MCRHFLKISVKVLQFIDTDIYNLRINNTLYNNNLLQWSKEGFNEHVNNWVSYIPRYPFELSPVFCG